ncbi:ABC1 family-like protein [Fragilaria crotonensis]|nr:ABC1 family-like protein [Fragilaria crotonensis]
MAPSLSHPKPNVVALSLLERWTKNFSRLYARRMLELAAASAATATIKTQLQEKIDKPMGWINWEKRDWTDDMMESMGTSKWKRVMMVLSRVINLSILALPWSFLLHSRTCRKLLTRNFGGMHCMPLKKQVQRVSNSYNGPRLDKICFHKNLYTLWTTSGQDSWSCLGSDGTIVGTRIGKDWKSLIDMETEPIGSGCIAQVYKGKLMDATPTFAKGTELAIKVQHPGIMHKVCVDFYILGKLANLLEGIPYLNLDYLSIRDTVDQFCNVMLRSWIFDSSRIT